MERANQQSRRRLTRPVSTSSLRLSGTSEQTNAEVDWPQNVFPANAEMDETAVASARSNLLMASTTLEAAFLRLQQIRNSLRELGPQGAIPESDTGSTGSAAAGRVGRGDIGPAYAALILSDAGGEHQDNTALSNLDRVHPPLPTAVQNLLSIVRSNQIQDSARLERVSEVIERLRSTLDGVRTSSAELRTVPPPDSAQPFFLPPSSAAAQQNGSRSSAPHHSLFRRRSLLEVHLRRNLTRPDGSDESATSLGRQVNARLAAGRAQGDASNSGLNSNTNTGDLRRPPFESATPENVDERPSSAFTRRRGTLPPFESPESDSDSSVTTVEATARPNTAYGFPDRQSTQLASIRRRARGSTIALLDRARSWEMGDNTGPGLLRPEVTELDPAENRSYRVRRRLNSDGEEHVHQIRMDNWWDGDDDDPNEWLIPSRERFRTTVAATSRVRRTMDNLLLNHRPVLGDRAARLNRAAAAVRDDEPSALQTPVMESSSGTTRRRRGWARLNADGDEIPTEEEEELERTRTLRRARHTTTTNSESGVSRRARMEYLVPTTRQAFAYSTDEEGGGGRVRMNLPSLGRRHGGGEPVVPRCSRDGEDEESAEPKVFGTDVPYYVDPLPMPLAEMTATPPARCSVDREFKRNPVSRQAEMAAR